MQGEVLMYFVEWRFERGFAIVEGCMERVKILGSMFECFGVLDLE